MKILAVALAALVSSSLAEESVMTTPAEYTSMNAIEQNAFERVAASCKADVQRLCLPGTQSLESRLGLPWLSRPLVEPRTTRDLQEPLFTFHRNPLEDFDSFLDHFLQPPSVGFGGSGFLFIMEDEEEDPPSQMMQPFKKKPCPFDTMMHQVSVSTEPERFEDVAMKMKEKGNDLLLLQGEQDEHVTTMARRLQEVTPDSLHEYRRSFLPFDTTANACLEDAFQAGKVSKECGNALLTLHSIRSQLLARDLQDFELMNQFSVFYIFVMLTMIVAIFKSRKIIRQQAKLRRLILTTVYRKPEIKRQVEIAAGQSVGLVPPLPRRPKLLNKTARWVRLGLFTAFAALLMFAPELMLPVLCGFAAFSFWMVLFSRPKAAICTCCCCGVTTDDVKNGNVTKTQACCNCCAGTGVCSLQCASCCGDDDGKGCSCCAGGGCCCCSGKSSSGGVEDGCCCCGCCCCSGKTSAGVEKGGCCCCCCCSCCSNMSPDKPKVVSKRTVLSVDKGSAYEGIPIQIV